MSELEYAARSVLLAGFAGPVVPAWLPRELEQGLGGVCLYGNNIAPGHDLTVLSRRLRELAPTAVLAIDEEGGDVTRLHTRTGSPYAGPAVLGRLDSPSVTRVVAAGIGAEMATAGIWLDLAPCADVNSDPLNPVIGTRSFGSDPELVARHTVAFVDGLASSGVAASVKHFPGHGDTRTDSHHGLPTVRAAAEVLRKRELAPFAAAVAAGAATVMTSHVVIESIDPDRPATFSPTLLGDVLRGELGFEGVIVTDALDMVGAQGRPGEPGNGIPAAAVRALVAGADLLCLGPGTEAGPRVVHQVVAEIVRAVTAGRLATDRLLDAAGRATRLRETWAGTAPSIHAELIRRAVDASARAADAVVADAPALPDARVVHLDTTANPAIGRTLSSLAGGSDPDTPDAAGAGQRLAPADLVTTPAPEGPTLLVVRGATADERVWAWLRHALDGNDAAWLVELGWPDPELEQHPWSARIIRTYGASAASTDALARRVFAGRESAT